MGCDSSPAFPTVVKVRLYSFLVETCRHNKVAAELEFCPWVREQSR